jgi:hypothetical protein
VAEVYHAAVKIKFVVLWVVVVDAFHPPENEASTVLRNTDIQPQRYRKQ